MTTIQENPSPQYTTAATVSLAVTALSKQFATGFQLGPLELQLEAGDTVGLIGKNGAGKTTLFQLLTGNLDASGGEARLAGRKITPDTPALKREIGYLPQDPALPRWATGHEVLLYAAKLYGLANIATVTSAAEDYWDCASYRDKPLGTLSYGMQKRVGLALATLHKPPYLILDEPFSGLDLSHIKALEQTIVGRGSSGQVTILSTHVIHFCARLCNRAVLLQAGQLRPLEPWQTLSSSERELAIETHFFAPKGTP